ncbi:MAG: DUF4835 domain-containing protein [Bacteroidetes bacterium GWF2_42_66]|nr:MAG: DUF4835 domain-containing protein [Bacteroidetes bacterium GWA2_42_15]OFY01293.1 MAG: DUF4835 domain-containing protein [Bacteroidetes bacterium GWE2_42_39]OFY42137.1 MAG: DUF4835 domain-containing protein [Bacteroidetes bacterium GWF2_42_66]HBL77658.1 DUF4835 domain-containing protein [Prolixibacteraceae bacterium]HCB62787.1 DUF4835 domain-containing protein [Bacteroidales bacterium]
MRKLLLVFAVLLIAGQLKSQELRCSISISAAKIQGANRNVFLTMQSDLTEFMNNRKWTDHVYDTEERIECNMQIQLDNQISSNEFTGSITVQLRRPVYNSSYETTVLNIKDGDFRAKYTEYQPIEFNETSNRDNLTNIMAYYAYIIIGMDYDSFYPDGGREYFVKAQSIVNNCQNAVEKGWKAYESERNRYWLTENILNKSYAPFRTCIYEYHRMGLDQMADKPQEGRANIANTLKNIQKVFRVRPSLYILQMFFDAKSDEMVNIFKESYPDEKNRVMTILNECDPSNGSKYEKIEETSTF